MKASLTGAAGRAVAGRRDVAMTAGQGAGREALRKGERGTSLRYRMMALARTRGDVISLGRGDPDIDTAPPIIDGALQRFAESEMSSGTAGPVRGLASLRRGIARRYAREKGVEIDPDREIVVTNGAQEGLFLAMLALVDPGDRVACQDPRYSSYDQAIGVAGGEIVPVPTGGDRPFLLGEGELREHARGARVLVFVNPSNPTGACVEGDGVEALAEAARDLDLVVLSDEIYEDVVFNETPFRSFLAVDGARGRTVVLSGFSKAYAMTGFRVGLPDRAAGVRRRGGSTEEHDVGVRVRCFPSAPRSPRSKRIRTPGRPA